MGARETKATGKWAQRGVPHRGWTFVHIEDLSAPDHVCEMCEVSLVRYVHEMKHPDYPGTLRVGCICAGHMEQNLVGARRRELGFKNCRKRRTRWLSCVWRVSARGNEYLNTGEFNVVIYPSGHGRAARVENRKSGKRRFTPQYQTANEAKLAAFDVMLEMKGLAA